MRERFVGEDGRRLLTQALFRQRLTGGDPALVAALRDAGVVEEYPPGTKIIAQDGDDNSIFMILAGRAAVSINGREVTLRYAGQHVGEMALVDESARRSADVVAREATVVLRIPEPMFAAIAERFPVLWRRVATVLGSRLRHRSTLVRARNDTPIMFIGSSKEGEDIVAAIQAGLDDEPIVVHPWTARGISAAYPLDGLLAQVVGADLGVLVVGPDDQVASRGPSEPAPRDNVLLELGMFLGGLGRERTFIVQPRGHDLKLPSDLQGLKALTFDPRKMSDVGPICTELAARARALGPR